ncbi:3'-5' exonuclease [Pseudoclavibacter caeni]|uniref:DNA 3'-5' helicase n=1 Tax=Pseudoclavibacter caeni TaxID=908846 RepID=A0A7C8BMJ0_9MICO|nr:3'-5' exonuclease [Pseudoclavibacter caeni]KAB1631367.1 AAA family ATPase [Pseudoclavibacter caeni]NYJ96769.1 superfamily I DNA/RNA helicase [Pseudoclavibacter caeni]
MTTNIIMTRTSMEFPREQTKKVFSFLQKLATDDSTPGLHIEPMHNPADARARTGRVDQGYRAVLFKLTDSHSQPYYVFAGAYPHDEAIKRARTTVCQVNPVNGLAELVEHEAPTQNVAMSSSSDVRFPGTAVGHAAPEAQRQPLLAEQGITYADLTDRIGIDPAVAASALSATDDDQLQQVIEANGENWQGLALIDLATGLGVEEVVTTYSAQTNESPEPDTVAPTSAVAEQDDQQIIDAMRSQAGGAEFTFIEGEDDPEFRRMLEEGSFQAWRVFLHPTQRRYVDTDYNGPFRLTGGAGTGKTVVLLHRARRLARENPSARIVLTTFTRSLADALQAQLIALDDEILLAEHLGESGVLVRGVDQLVSEVLQRGQGEMSAATQDVLGWPWESARTGTIDRTLSQLAREAIGDDLPTELRSGSFIDAEYEQVILPHRILTEGDYLRVRRPGRGVRLNRRARKGLWGVITAYRSAIHYGQEGIVSFSEGTAIAAEWLRGRREPFVDHLLVDESQDLTPVKFQFLRALVPEGRNDLFLAEDAQQRIYGQPVVLGRWGIKVVGRSRRLRLNYRTTAQNLSFAVRALQGMAYEDLEGEAVTTAEYRSARSGPEVRVLEVGAGHERAEEISRLLREWVKASNVEPSSLAVLIRSRREGDLLADQLARLGSPVTTVRRGDVPATDKPLLMTMHRAKGLEFARVILVGVDPDDPLASMPAQMRADPDRDDAIRKERSLIYVAASRARDVLVVL